MAVTLADVLIVAPIWLGESDKMAGAAQENDLYWTDGGFSVGSLTQGPGGQQTSSFEVMDVLIKRFANQNDFPALNSVKSFAALFYLKAGSIDLSISFFFLDCRCRSFARCFFGTALRNAAQDGRHHGEPRQVLGRKSGCLCLAGSRTQPASSAVRHIVCCSDRRLGIRDRRELACLCNG